MFGYLLQQQKTNPWAKSEFFSYPNDDDRRAVWMANCGTQHLADKISMAKSYRVCGSHFQDRMFLNTSTRSKLTQNAVPTIFKCKYKQFSFWLVKYMIKLHSSFIFSLKLSISLNIRNSLNLLKCGCYRIKIIMLYLLLIIIT